MQKKQTGRDYLKLALFVVLCISLLVTFITINDTNPNLARGSTALSTALALILGFIQVLPILTEFRRPKMTDEQVQNAFKMLREADNNLKEKQFDQAIHIVSKVIELLPKNAEAHRIRAKAHQGRGEIASALTDYNRAIELEPGYPFVHCERAQLLQQMGEYEKAIPDMLQCVALAPELAHHQLFQLAHTLFLVGKYDSAMKIFTEVLTNDLADSDLKQSASNHIARIENMRHLQETIDESDFKMQQKH